MSPQLLQRPVGSGFERALLDITGQSQCRALAGAPQRLPTNNGWGHAVPLWRLRQGVCLYCMMLRCVMSCYEMKHVTYVSVNVCFGGPRGGG